MLLTVMALLSAAAAVLLCWGKEALTWLWLLPVGFVGSFLALAVVVFGITMISTAAVRLDKEQEKDSKYYRVLIRLLAEAAHTILGMRVHATGLEKTPKDTRFLLVCNHLFDLILWC